MRNGEGTADMSGELAALLLAGQDGSEAYYVAVDHAVGADLAAVLVLAGHPDPAVRQAVGATLPLITDLVEPSLDAVAAVIALTADPDPRVRDWACFALAQQWNTLDTPQLRQALAARLDDVDEQTRREALMGLALRRDPRALPYVRAALSRPNGQVWLLELMAAGALGVVGLHDLVCRHLEGWQDGDDALTADAAARLTDPTGPGEDVLTGVAELYRRRAHALPDSDAMPAWHLMSRMLDLAPHRAADFFHDVLSALDDEAAREELESNSALAQMARAQPRP